MGFRRLSYSFNLERLWEWEVKNKYLMFSWHIFLIFINIFFRCDTVCEHQKILVSHFKTLLNHSSYKNFAFSYISLNDTQKEIDPLEYLEIANQVYKKENKQNDDIDEENDSSKKKKSFFGSQNIKNKVIIQFLYYLITNIFNISFLFLGWFQDLFYHSCINFI